MRIHIQTESRRHGVSLLALAIAVAAAPQASLAQASDVEEVVVTGSRVVTSGFTAPTPVTTVGPQELKSAAPAISDAISQLPSMKATAGPQQSSFGGQGGGGAFLNLRGLGPTRTLVLLDGRRFVPSASSGNTDANLFPDALVQRVEIVTGGASAAYGSDAVAGVVNYILDKTFSGVSMEVGAGVSEFNDVQSRRASIAAGQAFAGGRGHALFSVDYSNTDGVQVGDRPWGREGRLLFPNPAPTGPRNIVVVGGTYASLSEGGLITAGPLRGTNFGPGGVPGTFNFGQQAGATFSLNGDGPRSQGGPGVSLVSPNDRMVVFGRLSYDPTPNVTTYGELNYGYVQNHYSHGTNFTTGSASQQLPIRRENAFLPQSIRDRMVALNLTSFTLSKAHRDMPFSINGRNTTYRGVAGADIELGDNWDASVYYEHGRTRFSVQLIGIVEAVNLNDAVDAVFVPAGTPGLTAGTIVCRTTLTAPNNGCVPYNPFGPNTASAQAIRYSSGNEWFLQHFDEDVVAFDVRGELFSTWAGPVGVATGAEMRKQGVSLVADAQSTTFNPHCRAARYDAASPRS